MEGRLICGWWITLGEYAVNVLTLAVVLSLALRINRVLTERAGE